MKDQNSINIFHQINSAETSEDTRDTGDSEQVNMESLNKCIFIQYLLHNQKLNGL